ncbi:MAG: tetratricopeptide repeat protein [Terriglobia bacterium]
MSRLKRSLCVCVLALGVCAGALAHQDRSGAVNASTPRSAAATAAPISSTAQSILVRAIQLHQAGDFDEAIRAYRKYLSLDPGNFVARANLGAALAHQGRYSEAIGEYEQALKVRPGNPQVELNLALAHYKAMQLAKAVRELALLHAAEPGNLQIGLLLGDCYFRLGEDRKTAELLEPLEAAHPQERALDYLLGLALIRDGQITKGEVLVNKILSDGDSPEAHLMLGQARLAVNDTPGAMDELARALKLDPTIPLAHWLYGKALLQSGHRDEAMQAFRQELAIDPNEFEPNLYAGALLNEGQQYAQGLAYLHRALRVRPGSPQALYQIAVAQLGEGNLTAARKTLEDLVRANPTFVEAHVSLAGVYYRLHLKQDGDRERALVAKLNAEIQARRATEGLKSSYDGTAVLPGGKGPNPPSGGRATRRPAAAGRERPSGSQ